MPGSDTAKSDQAVLKESQSKSEERFAKAAFLSSNHRNEKVKDAFKNEVTNFPSALTMKGSMYHSSKSDLLKRFKQIPDVILESSYKEGNAVIVDLSVIVNALANRSSIKPKTIGDFCEYLLTELNILSRSSARIVVCDMYPEGLNLKELIQIGQGIGTHIIFDDKFQIFLK